MIDEIDKESEILERARMNIANIITEDDVLSPAFRGSTFGGGSIKKKRELFLENGYIGNISVPFNKTFIISIGVVGKLIYSTRYFEIFEVEMKSKSFIEYNSHNQEEVITILEGACTIQIKDYKSGKVKTYTLNSSNPNKSVNIGSNQPHRIIAKEDSKIVSLLHPPISNNKQYSDV